LLLLEKEKFLQLIIREERLYKKQVARQSEIKFPIALFNLQNFLNLNLREKITAGDKRCGGEKKNANFCLHQQIVD
jgi:hypothetical protein